MQLRRQPPEQAGFRNWLPEMGGWCREGSRLRVQGWGEQVEQPWPKPFRLAAGCARLVVQPKGGENAQSPVGCDYATCLPNLFLIGASKCGTTTLFNALVSHSRLIPMFAEPFTHNESHIFSQPRPARECLLRALRRSTPLSSSRLAQEAPTVADWRLTDAVGGPLYVVDYTPHYVVLPAAHARICATLAFAHLDCRFAKYVVVLRDPALRAYSQYVMKTHMRVKRYNERRSFDSALEHGIERTTRYAECWDVGLLGVNITLGPDLPVETIMALAAPNRCSPTKFEPNLFQAYVLKSAYYYQLLPWLANMPDATRNFVILTLERFDSSEFARLFNFLNLSLEDLSLQHLADAKYNTARDGGKSSLSDAQRRRLDDFFRPFNQKLDRLVGPLLGGRSTGYPT